MQKLPIVLMFLGHICVDTSQGILPVVLAKLREIFSLNYLQVGLVVMVLNITSSVIQPLFGYISDRFSTGWFVPWGILWTALCMGLLGWAPNYALILLLVGFAGLGTAAFHPRAMMIVSLASGSRRGLGVAIFGTAGNIGFALGPALGSALVLGLGIRATLALVIPAVLLLSAILIYGKDFLKRDAPLRVKKEKGLDKTKNRIPWVSLVLVCLIVTLRSWGYSSFLTYLPLYLLGEGIALETASLVLTVFLVGGAVAGLYGGHLSDRLGRRSIIMVSMLLYPLFASLMIMSRGGHLIWFWSLASGATLLASFSVTIVLAQELMPRHLGLASGLILGLGFGMGGIGSALSGLMADTMGLHKTLLVMALVPVLGSVLAALIRPARENPAGHS